MSESHSSTDEALRSIVLWSNSQPLWQRDALRRLLYKATLSQKDIDELLAQCKSKHIQSNSGDTQIDSNDPPETKQTFERLISEGFSEKVARELLGTVVIAEVFGVMKDGKPFDIERYVTALNKLPKPA